MVFGMQGPLNDLQGLTALVTGASSGIGLETALALARRGARVWMVSRDPVRGLEALRAVNDISQGVEARLILQDLGCRAGVRAAAEEFLQSGEPLHILVNNAAGVFFERTETVDGLEATFALNHLAPFHLTLLLLKRVLASAPARIVTVSSAGHARGRIRLDDLGAARYYYGFSQYCNTKLANVLFTYELARRIEGTGVVAHTLHPGVFRSSLGMNNRGLMRWLWKWAHIVMSSPDKAAATTIFVATAPEVSTQNGLYWSSCREKKSSRRSHDEALGKELWRISETLTGASFPELPRKVEAN